MGPSGCWRVSADAARRGSGCGERRAAGTFCDRKGACRIAAGDVWPDGKSHLTNRSVVRSNLVDRLIEAGFAERGERRFLHELTDAGRELLAGETEARETESVTVAALREHSGQESSFSRGSSPIAGGGSYRGAIITCRCGNRIKVNGSMRDARSDHGDHQQDRIDAALVAADLA